MTTFYLVRHGLTAHTGHKLTGWASGVHLSEEGQDQAAAAADHLSKVKMRAIYSSPIERTVETAGFIASRQGLKVKIRAGLGEVHYGGWTGRSFKTLTKTKLWEQIQSFPSAARFPEGETLRETQNRAVSALELIRTDHPKGAVCCVTHADVIRLVVAHYLGVHIDLFQRIIVDPASITVIGVSDHGPRVFNVNQLPPPVAKP